MRRSAGISFLVGVLVVVCTNHPITALAQNISAPTATPAAAPSKSGTLTVERIYGEPSLSGQLTTGLVWAPDGKRIGFFKNVAAGGAQDAKVAGPELWIMDAALGIVDQLKKTFGMFHRLISI